jgi:hypothetical protein
MSERTAGSELGDRVAINKLFVQLYPRLVAAARRDG